MPSPCPPCWDSLSGGLAFPSFKGERPPLPGVCRLSQSRAGRPGCPGRPSQQAQRGLLPARPPAVCVRCLLCLCGAAGVGVHGWATPGGGAARPDLAAWSL